MDFKLPSIQIRVGIIIFAAVLPGCAPGVDPRQLSKMTAALEDARQQSQIVFTSTPDATRVSSVEFALSQAGLKEEDFSAGVPAAEALAWDQDLARLEAYLQALQTLISPDRGSDFETSLVKLVPKLRPRRLPPKSPTATRSARASAPPSAALECCSSRRKRSAMRWRSCSRLTPPFAR